MATDPYADSDDPFGDAIAAQHESQPAARDVASRPTLAALAAAGLTDAEIAAATGLTIEAVRASPDVLVPLGEAHDMRVARAVYQAAVGGERWTEKLDKFGEMRRLREEVAPDTRAATFYLENRQRGAWGGTVKEAVRVIVVREGTRAPMREAIDVQTFDASDELENRASPETQAR